MLVATLFITLLSALAAAQDGPGTLAVVVRDSSGAAIPGATIRIVNEGSRAAVDAISDEQGSYRAASLVPGRYRVDTRLDGFDPAIRRIAIESGQSAAVDVTLNPSRLTESVVVTARRVEEVVQEVPIPVSVVSGKLVADTGAFNVNRLK